MTMQKYERGSKTILKGHLEMMSHTIKHFCEAMPLREVKNQLLPDGRERESNLFDVIFDGPL